MMTEDVKQKRKMIQQVLFQKRYSIKLYITRFSKRNLKIIDVLKPLNNEDPDFVNDYLNEKEIEFFKNGSNSTIPLDQYLELFYNHFANICQSKRISHVFKF